MDVGGNVLFVCLENRIVLVVWLSINFVLVWFLNVDIGVVNRVV